MKRSQPVGAALLLSLAGCGEEWSITRILVNPQPLGGSANVTPLVLVAPSNGGIASATVQIDVTVQRAQGSTSAIFLRPNLLFTRPNQSGVLLHETLPLGI